jgi:hypothetical protein
MPALGCDSRNPGVNLDKLRSSASKPSLSGDIGGASRSSALIRHDLIVPIVPAIFR